jgi:hypothetical protein
VNTNSKEGLREILPVVYLLARYYVAFTVLTYGFAKLMGAQFTVLDSELAKPMGDVSGFWLTWYYFGYSATYASLVAWAQIIGAVMLCFRRTTLAGSLLLLPVMVNIVSIDLWVIRFPLDSGALLNAVFVLLTLLCILAFHGRDLLKVLTARRDDLVLLTKAPRLGFATGLLVTASMVAFTAYLAYWLANVNNRDPTPIDGAWHVSGAQPNDLVTPDWIYFEYNRAYMVVFHFPNGASETHDFRVDAKAKTLKIAREWLTPGAEIFDGSWNRNADRMTISGIWHKTAPLNLTLDRKQMPVKDHP